MHHEKLIMQLSSDAEHPFVAAKPPVTDQLTYLTLLEYNLTNDNVGILHDVLKEDGRKKGTLMTDIGWDLIGLLLPFVQTAATKECLVDIARLGNPRECALKAEQGLRNIEWDSNAENSSDAEKSHGADQVAGDDRNVHPAFRENKGITNGAVALESQRPPTEEAEKRERHFQEPLSLMKFRTLVGMLGTLHSRIKTKKPSRFVASTLSAVLYSMSGAPASLKESCMDAALTLIERLKSSQRPTLPPRTGSTVIQDGADSATGKAPDPEENPQTSQLEPFDAQIQKRLIQSFLTSVVELWFTSLDDVGSDDDVREVPALAWAARLQEHQQPKKIVPRRQTFSAMFDEVKALKRRTEFSEKLVRAAVDSGLRETQLLETALHPKRNEKDDIESQARPTSVEDDPPENPQDIDLSSAGCLLLYVTSQFTGSLPQFPLFAQSSDTLEPLQIFPDILRLSSNVIGPPGAVISTTNPYPNGLLDALLFLALIALSRNAVGDPAESFPEDHDAFPRFLQTISLISANAPNSSIRYCAHLVTATTLRSHPEPAARLGFIRDTLMHAPLETLKAEAVGWLKGEILEANVGDDSTFDGETSVFATPLALESLSVYLYPDLTPLLPRASNSESGERTDILNIFAEAIKPRLPFLLSVLNFHFLLLSLPKSMRERLDVLDLHKEADVAGGFITPLREAIVRVEGVRNGSDPDMAEEMQSDALLLLQAIEAVEKKVVSIVKADI